MQSFFLPQKRPSGLAAFTVFVVGQIISLMGSSMTLFAANLWAWEKTGKATTLSISTLAGFAPTIFLIPVAGALVDRWNRKVVMMLSDLGAGLATLVLLLLLTTGYLQVWHLYVANVLSGIFGAFQFPAASAAMTLIVPKTQYGRANGLMWLTTPAANVFGPILAAALLRPFGFAGIMLIDIATCLVAVSLLLFIVVPPTPRSAAGHAGEGHLLGEIAYGFRYIFERPSLLGIQLIFFAKNLFSNPAYMVLVSPMILARTGNDEVLLGTVMSTGAIGGLVGGAVLGIWGGPKRRIHGVLLGMIALYLLGQGGMALGRDLWIWSASGFLVAFFLPIINGANQAIWQAKVPPDIQGRVFASRRLIAQFPTSFAMLFIGPLADRVFEPAMAPGGALVPWLGRWLGAGPGCGMALMLLMGAILGVLIGLGGYLHPSVRDAEDILPDYDN
ncbi:MAG: MFS transporter [Anaerolineae bacterium]|nr:MFS transporter [Anaerolineae bacterium]